MSKFSGRNRNRFIFTLLMLGFLFSGTEVTFAHNPHDIIDASEISPNYDQDKTVFIAVSVEGLFRSTDAGSSWKQLVKGLDNKGPISSIVISPAFEVDQTVFVSADGDGIYRSHDGGASWIKVNKGLDRLGIKLLSISDNYDTDNVLLAADTQGRLYKKNDNEDSWYQVLDKETTITAMAFFADQQPSAVLIGDQRGDLHLSTDGGEHWQAIHHLADGGAITSIAVSPNVSRDGTVFVGTEKGGVFKTVDRGASFVAANNGLLDSAFELLGNYSLFKGSPKSIRSVVISPDYETDKTVFVSTWYEAVYRSNDEGESWQLYDQGLTTDKQADTAQYKSPHFRNLRISKTFGRDQTIFLEGYDGLFRSTNGGQVWTQMETLSVSQIWRLAISSQDEDNTTIAITTALAGIYSIDRQGMMWAINNRDLDDIALKDVAFSPNYQVDNTIFLTSDDFILKSTDRGRSWDGVDLRHKTWRTDLSLTLQSLGMPKRILRIIPFLQESTENKQSMLPHRIAVSPNFAADNTLYFGSRGRGVYRSVDGGLNWSPVWENRTIHALVISPDFSFDRTLFVGTRDEGAYKSVDGGDTWQPVNNGLEPAFANVELPLSVPGGINLIISPDYKIDQTLYAGSATGLFKTVNGGESWQKLEGVPYGGLDIKAMAISPDYKNDHTVIFSVRARGLFRTNDEGGSFTEIGQDLINNNYDLNMVEFSPSYVADNTIYGVSNEAVFHSTDGGHSWEILPRPIRYEDRREMIRYEGQWKVLDGKDFSATSITYSDEPQVKAVLDFVGTGVTWLGTKSNDQGIARVYIDGEYQAEVDQFDDAQEAMVTSYSIADLDHGPHTITIEVSETKNPASTGYRIAIDAFDILP